MSTPRRGFTVGAGEPGPVTSFSEEDDGSAAADGGAQTQPGRTNGPGAPSGSSGDRGTRATGAPGGGSGRQGTGSNGPRPSRSPGASGDVVGDTIVVSVVAGFSGARGAIVENVIDTGFATWVNDVNDRGGIHNRRVVLRKVDNHDTAEGGVAACKEVLGNGTFLPMVFTGEGGADFNASDCLDAAGVTTLSMQLGSFSPRWKHVYAATRGSQARVLASLIKTGMAGDPDPKIGLLYINDPTYLSGRDAFLAEANRLGLRVVHQEALAPNQASYVSELSRTRDAGATTVVVAVATEVVGVLRDARAIGYQARFTGYAWAVDELSIASPELFRGIRAVRAFNTAESEAYESFRRKAEKYRRAAPTTTPMLAYGVGVTIERVLVQAGPNLTRASVASAVESLSDYNNGVSYRLSWGPGARMARVGMYPVECCNPNNTWKALGSAQFEF